MEVRAPAPTLTYAINNACNSCSEPTVSHCGGAIGLAGASGKAAAVATIPAIYDDLTCQ